MQIDKCFSKVSKFNVKLNVFCSSSDCIYLVAENIYLFQHIGGLSFLAASLVFACCDCMFFMTERQNKNSLLDTLTHIFLSADRVNSTAMEEKKNEMMDGIYLAGNENSLGVCVHWLLCK